MNDIGLDPSRVRHDRRLRLANARARLSVIEGGQYRGMAFAELPHACRHEANRHFPHSGPGCLGCNIQMHRNDVEFLARATR